MMMVVGYAPTSPRVAKSGRIEYPASWEVMLLGHGQLTIWPWTRMNDQLCLLEEWDESRFVR